jgi:ribonuclease-3
MAVRNPLEPPADRHQVSEPAFGHSFRRPELLREALTHRSAVPRSHGRPSKIRSNERLEFVGDRVLGLLMAEWLAERFPEEAEGLLARRHADLVAEPQLAEVGLQLALPDLLIVAPNEARAGVGRGVTVVADALEAVLGALYMDGGLDAARQLIRRAWAGAIDAQAEPPKHPKSDLKEWLEARGAALPPFVEQSRTGPAHALVFTVTVQALGRTGSGVANTKQAAERDAAADLLRQLQT